MEDYIIADGCQIEGYNEILKNYFGYKTEGIFVEVGAYDGNIYSNTFGLSQMGWSGICIEPIKEYADRCKENHKDHPNVKVLEMAVGNKTGIVQMHVCGPLSTYSDFYLNSETWKTYYDPNALVDVQIDTLDNVLFAHNFQPKMIDVISIDTEGSEMDVLDGFFVEYWLPRMIVIEAHEKNNHQELARFVPDIEQVLWQYKKIYSGWVNNIYVL